MVVTMRLYHQTDLDLLYLFRLKGFSLPKTIKRAVRIYLAQGAERIHLPPTCKSAGAENDFIEVPKKAQFHLYLDDERDADIIRFIKGIAVGYRNSALKNITKAYLEYPVMVPFSAETYLVFSGRPSSIDL